MELQQYWETVKAPTYTHSDVVGRRILESIIRRIAPRSLIEVGCGNGILFKIYMRIHVPQVAGLDFSPTMLRRAKERCLRHDYKVQLWHADLTQPLPSDIGKYDLCISRTCLMHISPDAIEKAVTNIALLADEAVIFEYWEPIRPKTISPHNFLHDYTLLFEQAGYATVESHQRGDQPQVIFHFKKEKKQFGRPR